MSLKNLLLKVLLAFIGLLGAGEALAARTTTYYHNDGLGSVVAATNDAGTVLWRKDYAPFGEQIDDTPDNERTAYTGKQHDSDTGLTDFGARQYDPEIGRFLNIDPTAFVESNTMSFNRYLYVNNNPYKYVDPDGEFLNFAAKFVLDVGLNMAINYYTTGNMNVGAALRDSAIGMINPASTLAKVGALAKIAASVVKKCNQLSCFVAGTAILTENGYEPIETLEVGDLVWAHDPDTGVTALKPIVQTFVNTKDSVWELMLEKNGFTYKHEVTGSHPYYVLGGDGKGDWVQVAQLVEGSILQTEGGDFARIVSLKDTRVVLTTYNFEVQDINTYYVGAAKVLVHNCRGGTIYLRVDKATGAEYVGKAKTGRLEKRKAEHASDHPDKEFEFHVLEDVKPGGKRKLNVAEEDWIRAGGGPKSRGGRLENDKYALNDADYRAGGGSLDKPTK
jgi:RHS repeat-associated protein